jgi:hypothetical protein
MLRGKALVMTDIDFAADVREGEERLTGQALVHFKIRVEKATHILAELRLLGIDPDARLRVLFVPAAALASAPTSSPGTRPGLTSPGSWSRSASTAIPGFGSGSESSASMPLRDLC